MTKQGNGKTILLGVSGGIAAYKAIELCSKLKKQGYAVNVVLTENASRFVAPLTFETIAKSPCVVSTFERGGAFDVEHIALAQSADLMVVAPATANVLAKLAHGICDDMLTTTALAVKSAKIVCPAMNTAMYENPATQRNLDILRADGYRIVDPASGKLACGDVGKGRLANLQNIVKEIGAALFPRQDFTGKKVLITAGPTQETIDPVRYITNRSTGKMGYSIANAAKVRGADVTLISGKTSLPRPDGIRYVETASAQQMYDAVMEHWREQDVFILAAAVADYCPLQPSEQKIKKRQDELCLRLVRTPDILAELGRRRSSKQFLCGFSMETENLVENSIKKLESKQADLMIANDLTENGAGFSHDTNRVAFISRNGVTQTPLMSKEDLAHEILTAIEQGANV